MNREIDILTLEFDFWTNLKLENIITYEEYMFKIKTIRNKMENGW